MRTELPPTLAATPATLAARPPTLAARPPTLATLAGLAALTALATLLGHPRAARAEEAADDRRIDAKQPVVAAKDGEAAPPGRTTEICIDQEIADRLAVKRKRRGAVDRLFVKQGRHELSFGGGYYASDLLSGTYLLAGSYTYHMTDETAVEFSGAWTHANADIIRALEDQRGELLSDTYARMIFGEALLVWSPVYGKLRLGGSIVHFDLHADLGVGVIDSTTSRGASGVLGFGIKMFAGNAVAFRIDARNRTFRQELLEERFLVNDTAITAGLSVFFPFRN